jgi:hypothetical protein
MAGITLAQAEAQLALWLAASEAVASKQSYRIGERTLTLVDAADILRMIEFWSGKAAALGGQAEGRGRLRTIVPAG